MNEAAPQLYDKVVRYLLDHGRKGLVIEGIAQGLGISKDDADTAIYQIKLQHPDFFTIESVSGGRKLIRYNDAGRAAMELFLNGGGFVASLGRTEQHHKQIDQRNQLELSQLLLQIQVLKESVGNPQQTRQLALWAIVASLLSALAAIAALAYQFFHA